MTKPLTQVILTDDKEQAVLKKHIDTAYADGRALLKEYESLITDSEDRKLYVDDGAKFDEYMAVKAGVTMTEVISAIMRVTDILGEISAASNEESLGVSQVG